MKLLFCERCGDIISPNRQRRVPRRCTCGTFAVWWEDPVRGVLRLWDHFGHYEGPRDGRRNFSRKRNPHEAWVIGLHNSLLRVEGQVTAGTIASILEDTPSSYIFKQIGSLVIKIRPGESGDTDWAEFLPGQEPSEDTVGGA